MAKLSPPLLAQALRDRVCKDTDLSDSAVSYMIQAADQLDSLYNQLHPRATADIVREDHRFTQRMKRQQHFRG